MYIHPMHALLSIYAELPWVLLFICLMFTVEMQLRYCLPCLRATAKVVQSGLMLLAIRLWLDNDFGKSEEWAATLRGLLNQTAAQK